MSFFFLVFFLSQPLYSFSRLFTNLDSQNQIPEDGPAGKLLRLLGRHMYRPAHLHFMVIADGFKSVTTQIYDSDSKYLENDTVFAVKDGLTVHFVPRKGDPQAEYELEYNVTLSKKTT